MLWAVSALGTRRGSRPQRDRHAFTLIEVLVATGLTLMLMAAVAGIFVLVSENISGARATIEMNDRVRATQLTLQKDLAGLTARGVPPLDPALGLGYFEIIEGPVGPCGPPDTVLVNKDGIPIADTTPSRIRTLDQNAINFANLSSPATFANGDTYSGGDTWDTTVGDYDDVLMFTTRSDDTPFTGRGPSGSTLETQSNVAEIAWFLRGRTLYRRVLLVDPTYNATPFTDTNNDGISDGAWAFSGQSYYGMCDVSVRQVGNGLSQPYDPSSTELARLVANSLGDLTKRENRFGHPPMIQSTKGGSWSTSWPHDARYWGAMRLPTLRECSAPTWPLPFFAGSPSTVWATAGVVRPAGMPFHPNATTFTEQPMVYFPPAERVRYDAWDEPRQWEGIDVATGGIVTGPAAPGQSQAPLLYNGSRFSDDVILTNVVGFDVKVWDPGAPIFQREMLVGVGSGTTQIVTIGPGDPGFAERLGALYQNPSGSLEQPVSYGAFVDLGWGVDPTLPGNPLIFPPPGWTPPPGKQQAKFNGAGVFKSGLAAIPSDQTDNNAPPDYRARVYDTGSSHYERDGIDQGDPNGTARLPARDGRQDEGSDGLDTDSQNGIDDAGELEAPPPYAEELKAIQVKIRVFEPDSRQVREVTVVQELVSQ